MTTSKTIAALLGPTLVASAVSLLVNLDKSQTLIEKLSQSPALIMIAGYAAFVPGLAIVYFYNRWTAGQLAGVGNRDGMALGGRRPPAHGVPHTARRNDGENRSVRRRRLSCLRDRIPADRRVPFVQGIPSRVIRRRSKRGGIAIDIALSRSWLTELLAGLLDLKMPHRGSPAPSGDRLTLTVPAGLKRAGREMCLLVENANDQRSADPSLLRILARAHDIQARLIQNPTLSVHDIAKEEQVSAAYLYTLLRLPWLAPDITTAIINGRSPPQLTAQSLKHLTPRLPASWPEQRKLLGFR